MEIDNYKINIKIKSKDSLYKKIIKIKNRLFMNILEINSKEMSLKFF